MSEALDTSHHEALICLNCRRQLVVKQVTLSYLGHHFTTEVPRCESCGQIYLPPDLVREKIARVEQELEDK